MRSKKPKGKEGYILKKLPGIFKLLPIAGIICHGELVISNFDGSEQK